MKYTIPMNPLPYLKSRIIGCLFLSLLLASCHDFLKDLPDDRLKITTLKEAAWLLPKAQRGTSLPSAVLEILSDNVTYSSSRRNGLDPHQSAWYKWKTFIPDPPSFPYPSHYGGEYTYWYETYEAIAYANEALYAVSQLPIETPGNEKLRDAIRGEALLVRAYRHFMLVNVFALHYNPETAAQNPGIPYVTTPEKEFIKTYDRHSVAEVYQKVEEDMKKGMKLMKVSSFTDHAPLKYMFTPEAAWAFASRYYLFKSEWDSCIAYSNKLLGTAPEKYVRDMGSSKYNNSGREFQTEYFSYELPANIMFTKSTRINELAQKIIARKASFGPVRDQVGLLFGNYNPALAQGGMGSTGRSGVLIFKALYTPSEPFPGAYDARLKGVIVAPNAPFVEIASGGQIQALGSYVSFMGEEVLLNRAEAYTHQGKLAQALADLQVLTDKRYMSSKLGFAKPQLSLPRVKAFLKRISFPGADALSDRQALLHYLLRERRKEFFHQGMRWFDIKRHRLSVKHVLPPNTYTLKANDPRKALQIPLPAMDINKLAPNQY